MPHRMRRREFLVESSRTALSFSLLSPLAQAQGGQKSPKSKDGAPWEPLLADLEKLIPKLMKEAIVPGLSIAVIKDAKLVWRRPFGVKDSASREPVDNDTVFEGGSMSKPVFAYAVMKLCEKGVINLDTPLTKYTSERFLEGDPRLELITARHVLSHSSGFQNWRSDNEPLKIHFAPGEKYLYSGEGYSYLQSVVTRMTGQQIEQYMKANLFVPFGMGSSGYVWNDTFERHAARPHDEKGRSFDKGNPTATVAARYAAAGGLHTTPTDYARFLIEVIAPKPSDAFRLKKDSIEEMARPHVKTNDEFSSSWGLGWQIEQTGVIHHAGYNKGFHSHAVASVKGKSGVVIMTNGENGNEVIRNLLLGDVIQRLI